MGGFQRVVGATFVAAAALVLGGGNCGPTAPGCSHDAECGTDMFCRTADGTCQVLGECAVPSDCDEQPLFHTQCAGSWSCAMYECSWSCTMPLPGMGQTCGANDACAAGLECVHYYGIAGPSGPEFRSCEQRCSSSADCSGDATCVTIADGPGSVCRARQG